MARVRSKFIINGRVIIFDGVVKILHFVRCYNFRIITTYRMYTEIIGKLHASNMKLFTYPSKIELYSSLSLLSYPPKSS